MKVEDFVRSLEAHVPNDLAAEWDNVGLLVGRRDAPLRRLMTTLDVTDRTLGEAVERRVDLLITHHPLPFRPLKRLSDADATGRLLLTAAEHRIAIYSPHTAWDDAAGGINDLLAAAAGLIETRPLVPLVTDPRRGHSRIGRFASPTSIAAIFARIEAAIGVGASRANSPWDREVRQLAICCGSGGAMLPQAAAAGCDALLTGEATYHQCLEAAARGVAILLLGHHRSEAFAMRELAARLREWTPGVEIFSCDSDTDSMWHA